MSDKSGLLAGLSGHDALYLLEMIERAVSCRSDAQYKDLFCGLQALFPFESAITILGHQDDRQGLVLSSHVNISFPKGWLAEYLAKSYLLTDSIVLQNFISYDVQTWSFKRKALYRKKEITSLGLDFGLRECRTHGWRPSPGGTGSMFCFAGPAMEDDVRSATILRVIVPHLHVALSRLCGNARNGLSGVELSARETEVLDWLKEGKSSWDISIILGISERTVNFHVYNMMRKLGVTSRSQAVAVAAGSGLIQVG